MSHQLASAVVAALETKQRIFISQPKSLTFFGKNDLWMYLAIMDDRTCDTCIRYDTADVWHGNELRREFPYLEIHDENTIRVNAHPNCRCLLIRLVPWED